MGVYLWRAWYILTIWANGALFEKQLVHHQYVSMAFLSPIVLFFVVILIVRWDKN